MTKGLEQIKADNKNAKGNYESPESVRKRKPRKRVKLSKGPSD